MKKVLFVCLGNICRSPMAEMIFKKMVKESGKEKEFFIDSAGISDENVWNHSGIYPKTKEVLRRNKIDFEEHYARQITRSDADNFDYIVCMEESHKGDLLKMLGKDVANKVYKLLDFTEHPADIDDPWYHRDFDRTYAEISYGCECLLKELISK